MPDDAQISRRRFQKTTLVLMAAGVSSLSGEAQERKPVRGRIRSIEPQGVLVRACTVLGETRADDVVPAHPNGIQVSRDRWLIVYATRGFRGVDDDLSIIYQLRRGSPDGPVVREGALMRTRNDWDPLGTGARHVRQHGHPVAFGVPKGAVIGGRPAASANLFVAKWRVVARALVRERNMLRHGGADQQLADRTQAVEWVQFRLNEREDDIDIVQPVSRMRQRGHESGEAFCSAQGVTHMNQSFTPPVPFNRERTEWADCNHFDGGRIAVLKYAFDPRRQRYDWAATGPLLGEARRPLSEASLARVGEQWIVAARAGASSGIAWVRTDDPFTRLADPVLPREPRSNAPLTAFTCGDGVLRLFTGARDHSASRNSRDPLFAWDIDPRDGFASSERRVVFDSVRAGLRIRPTAVPKVDMCKLLAPQGRTQILVYRVSVRSYNHPYVGSNGEATSIPAINREEKESCAIYYSRITFEEDVPPMWQFA